MSTNSIFRIGAFCAYVSAGATIVGFVTLIIFFMVGDPYGIINDISSIVIALSALSVLFALYQLHRSAAPAISLAALGIGVLAALNAAVFQAIFVLSRKSYGDTVTLSFGIFGISLFIYGWLALRDTMLPRGLAWFGIFAGAGYVLVITGFNLGGPNHPLTYAGGLASIVAYPTWAIWLGRILSSKMPARG